MKDHSFFIVVVGFPTVELDLFLEVLVFLNVLVEIGLLSSINKIKIEGHRSLYNDYLGLCARNFPNSG